MDLVRLDEAAGALAGHAACLVLVWLALTAACSALSALPGVVGPAGSMVRGLLVPRVLGRTVAAVLGVGLLAAPAAAQDAGPFERLHEPPAPTAPPVRPAPAPVRPAVVVRTGDTLWSIAAGQLSRPTRRSTAVAWPRWYAANRAVIGPDPDLIHPGQRLTPPPADRPGGQP